MADYALIALSPSGYNPTEMNKTLILHDHLKREGYNVRLLSPESKKLPYDTIPINRVSFLDGLEWIRQNSDMKSNVVIYLSDSPRQVTTKIPLQFQKLVLLLEGDTEIEDFNFGEFVIWWKSYLEDNQSISINLSSLTEDLDKALDKLDFIDVRLEGLIKVLYLISKNGPNEFPDMERIIGMIQEEGADELKYAKKGKRKGQFFKNKLFRSENIGQKVSIDVEVLITLLKKLSEEDMINRIHIRKLIDLVQSIYYGSAPAEKIGWIDLREKWNTEEIVYFNEIEKILDNIKHKKLYVIGSGERSGILQEHLKGYDRILISSMGSGQEFDTDYFNMANGLIQPHPKFPGETADEFIVGYFFEAERLSRSYYNKKEPQFMQLWYDPDYVSYEEKPPEPPPFAQYPMPTVQNP